MIQVDRDEKVRRYRAAMEKLNGMKAKMAHQEAITPQNLLETRQAVEAALAVITCCGRKGDLRDGLSKIVEYCALVQDRDIFPIAVKDLNTDESIGRRKDLVMMIPPNCVLRDLVVPASGDKLGYRKMFAVPSEYEGPSLHDIKDVVAIGGLTLEGGEWVPAKLPANES